MNNKTCTTQFCDSYHSTKCNNLNFGRGKRMRRQVNKKRRRILKQELQERKAWI